MQFTAARSRQAAQIDDRRGEQFGLSFRRPSFSGMASLKAVSINVRENDKQEGPATAGPGRLGGVDGTRTRDPRRDRPVF